MNCPHCQTPNREHAKFCDNCGQPLQGGGPSREPVERPAPLAQPRLHQFIPKELLAKLEAAKAAGGLAGERRIVTILFCDVKGSTAMAEKLDPEEWAEIMNGAFEHLIAPVYRYEGTLARLMGDAILAFFGAPIAHEDDPQRAVLAGLEIVAGMQPYRERIKRERSLDFNVRVGINTGLAVVGQVGSDLRAEYTAMGDAVNLAARMEQTAQPGTVQISGDTHKRIAPLFECESLGGIEVKGKTEPVPAYRVIARKTQPGRLRGIEGLDAPLIGRATEMRALQNAFADLQSGRGRIVCVIGEAGLGKSRLIAETCEVASQDLTGLVWSESRGLSYDTTHPYGQFQQHLRYLCGATENDSAEAIRAKLARALGDVPPHALAVLNILLGTETGTPQLEGEAFKRELFEVMLHVWRAERGLSRELVERSKPAARAPNVFVFDDLHWADPASVELLLHLFQLVPETPVIFLCAFRPDAASPAEQVRLTAQTQHAQAYTEIRLGPLSSEDSHTLIDNLLTVSELPTKLRERILLKAEGNPFFVEEVVRTLIDSGAVARDESGLHWRATTDAAEVTIPDNVQALLTARIDRLEEAARYTLQLASVVGRSFYYRVLKLISEATNGLDQQLRTLQHADLIREAARDPELEYSFRHALTQEAAYNSILLKRRRELHRRVGETMETLFTGQLEEQASRLGYHFYEANDLRAQHYYTLAGDAAARLYANTEAAAHYRRALEIAKHASENSLPAHVPAAHIPHRADAVGERFQPSANFLDLYLRFGKVLELIGQHAEALANYLEMEALAREQHDRAQELAAVLARATVHSTFTPVHNPAQAEALLAQALTLARELRDRASESKILWNLMLVNVFTNRLIEAIQYGEPALALARELNQREQLAFTLNDLGRSYADLGDLERAYALLEEARALWRELGNRPMLADNLFAAASANYFSGNYDQALALAAEGFQISEAIDNPWGKSYSRLIAGFIYLDRGLLDQAIKTMTTCIQLGDEGGLVASSIAVRTDLGWVYATLGDADRGLELVHTSYATAAEKLPEWKSLPVAVLVRIHLRRGDLAEAEAAVNETPLKPIPLPFERYAVVIGLAQAELAFAQQDYAQALKVVNDLLAGLPKSSRANIPEILYLKSRILLAQSQEAEAREVLHTAHAQAEALGSHFNLWPILLALSEVEQRSGNQAEVEELRKQAREIVEYMAGQIGEAELREAFLKRMDGFKRIRKRTNG
jgi:predicted ATPase/class 3 adenylate cyclase